MEYLLLHGGSRGHLLRYELLWDSGSGDENHLCGLLNVDENEGGERKFVSEAGKSASGSGQVRARFGQEKPASGQMAEGSEGEVVRVSENAAIREKNKPVLPPSPPLSASSTARPDTLPS